MNTIEPTVSIENGVAIESHPAYAVANVSFTTWSNQDFNLFQSIGDTRNTVTLTISPATREDSPVFGRRIHDGRQPIVEVQMTPQQWADLITLTNRGTGTPVTLTRREGELVPGVPAEPRLDARGADAAAAVAELLSEAKESLVTLERAVTEKQGVKAIRSAMDAHHAAIANAEANADHAMSQFAKLCEKIVRDAHAAAVVAHATAQAEPREGQ